MGSFDVVFTQERSGFASPRAGKAEPYGRIQITREVSEADLHELLSHSAEQRVDPAPGP